MPGLLQRNDVPTDAHIEQSAFYLLGDDLSQAKPVFLEDCQGNMKTLRSKVAAAFHVADPTTLTFHDASGQQLEDFDSIAHTQGFIGCLINGQEVRDAVGPQGLPLFGSFYEIFPDHLGNHARLFAKYGNVIKTTNMGKTTYFTNDPYVAAIAFAESPYFTKLITADHPLFGVKDNHALFVGDTETENWRLSHRFIPPSMSPKAVRHYTPLMQHTVRDSFKVFDELDRTQTAFNAYQFMLKLASQTIGKFALDMDLKQFESVDSPLHPLVKSIANLLSLNKKVVARGEWYRHLPFGDPARLKASRTEAYSLVQDCIDSVKAGEKDLPMEEAALKASCVVDYLVRATDKDGNKLPEELIQSNMVIISGAGFTTTSALLSWLLYALVTYPGNQERLLQELVDNGINNDIDWSPDLPNKLPFLDKFIKETQRLHNPSFQPGRTTKTEVVLPGGYRLPPNSVIVPALYALHSNPEHWHDPQRFDPDRWDTEQVKNRHRYSYIPFAAGPRGCIGFNFALQETKVLLAELVYRYEFIKDDLEAVEYDPEFQLVRPLNLFVQVRSTHESPASGISVNVGSPEEIRVTEHITGASLFLGPHSDPAMLFGGNGDSRFNVPPSLIDDDRDSVQTTYPFSNIFVAEPTMAQLLGIIPCDADVLRLWRLYNEFVHPFNPVVHSPDDFETELCEYLNTRSQYQDHPHLEQHSTSLPTWSWLSLVLAVLAAGAQYSDNNSEWHLTSKIFVRASFQCLRATNCFVSADASQIRAMVLIAMCMRNDMNVNASWIYMGIIIRFAQSLGLHRRPSTSMDPEGRLQSRTNRHETSGDAALW
ncbi:cytochrome P450, partial [Aureobasidium melanogenum]